MTQLFEIPVPVSANRMYRVSGGRPRPSKAYRAFIRDLGWYINAQRIKPQPTPCRFSLGIVGGKGWTIAADTDNRIKPTLDALQRNNILENDNVTIVPQVEGLYRARVHRSDVCRCFIRLTELEATWLDLLELPPPILQ